MKVLFATAEFAPKVKVGGLGDASSGLVRALRDLGIQMEVVLPDYEGEGAGGIDLDVPGWVGGARAGTLDTPAGQVTLVSSETLTRPHPYTDQSGEGWPDNDFRFMAFSAAIAALVEERRPDVLHLNDWHTGATLGFLQDPPPTVLTMHNPAYQGTTSGLWLSVLERRPEAYEWYGGTNPLTGAIALADRVVTVSPTFATELLRPETSFGLDGPLAARGSRFSGILNGIETDIWDPSADPHLPVHYDTENPSRKRELGRRLSEELSWSASRDPIIGMVTRLTGQKGVDIALEVAKIVDELGARMVLLGSGEAPLAESAERVAGLMPDLFRFRHGYDEQLAHLIFGGSDIYLVPSRFEPCGLTQMQAMRYGAIPVVTNVGGLADTVVDADANPTTGTGFVAVKPTAENFTNAVSRAIRAWRSTKRRGQIRRLGMSQDWSWMRPSRQYLELYRGLTSAR